MEVFVGSQYARLAEVKTLLGIPPRPQINGSGAHFQCWGPAPMTNPDVRWQQRFSNYRRALEQLEDFLSRPR